MTTTARPYDAEDFAGPMGARCCARRTGCCAHAEADFNYNA